MELELFRYLLDDGIIVGDEVKAFLDHQKGFECVGGPKSMNLLKAGSGVLLLRRTPHDEAKANSLKLLKPIYSTKGSEQLIPQLPGGTWFRFALSAIKQRLLNQN